MADSTVLTETEKSNRLITIRVMMTIMCISSPSSTMELSKNYTNAKNSCLFQYYMRTHQTPSLLTPLTFWIFLHIIHPQWKCQTRKKKGADSETKTDDLYQKRDEEEDLCLLCIIVCLWVRVCLYLCVVLGFPLCWFAYFAVFLWLETECIIGDLMMVYVDFDHLNLGSIEMKVVPQQKGLMVICI